MLTIIFSLGLALLAHAQPAIEFDTLTHDFGTAAAGDSLTHIFTFTNKGTEPLKILKTTTDCGCTAAVVSAEEILPGATGAISVTMSVKSAGKVQHGTIVETSASNTPTITLTVSAEVRRVWELSPKALFTFMDTPMNSQHTQMLILKNLDNQPFNIISTKLANPKYFSVGIGEATASGIPIYVTFTADSKKQTLTDNLTIQTDLKENATTSTSILAEISGIVRFNRRQLYFGIVQPNQVAEREVILTITPTSGVQGDFKITKIESDKENVTGEVVSQSEAGITVKMIFKASEKLGYTSGKVIFHTNLEAEPIAELPYSALVRSQQVAPPQPK
ncbi:MAG: DUF1573 domain-containing protein [bacterium]|nr:DUF1573 domain-containing protein [bacterium]